MTIVCQITPCNTPDGTLYMSLIWQFKLEQRAHCLIWQTRLDLGDDLKQCSCHVVFCQNKFICWIIQGNVECCGNHLKLNLASRISGVMYNKQDDKLCQVNNHRIHSVNLVYFKGGKKRKKKKKNGNNFPYVITYTMIMHLHLPASTLEIDFKKASQQNINC